ncbi:MAG: tetratricopeptide repeat protein, partial [Ktedonobacteraceae bacterium]
MAPGSPFLDQFNGEGWLKKQLTRALLDRNVETSLSRLRQIQQRLKTQPTRYAYLWIPFLDIFLHQSRVHALTPSDLIAVVEMGNILTNIQGMQVHPEDIWWKAIRACDMRGEERQSRTLLTYLYNDPVTRREWKIWAVHELAQRGAKEDEYLAIYMDFLRHVTDLQEEKVVLNVLEDICTVHFDIDIVRLKRVKEVAELLLRNRIQIAKIRNTLGIHALLIEQDTTEAIKHFITAFRADNDNRIALRGLLAAWIQDEDYQQVVEITQFIQSHGHLADPIIAGLTNLGKILQWLNSSDLEGQPHRNAQYLEKLKDSGLDKYTGDVLNMAIGRLHLIKGNAQRAVNFLYPLVAKYPHKPQWGYYAALANVLVGDKEAVAHCFTTFTDWPGNWTIACLLLDVDPVLAQKHKVYRYLEERARTQVDYASVISARIALARSTRPDEVKWDVGFASLEEDLESLRTFLGYAYYVQSSAQMQSQVTSPLFQRLPLADQIMWYGLQALLTSHHSEGRTLLEESATKFGYQRAALVLSVYLLERNLQDEAKHFLDRVSDKHKDTKIELLMAFIDGYKGKIDTSTTKLNKLAAANEPRVQYALGNLYLRQAEEMRKSQRLVDARNYYMQAEIFFDFASQRERYSSLADSKALALSAKFAFSPKSYVDIWSGIEHLDSSHRQRWLVWQAFLARLWYGHPSDMAAIYEEIIPLMAFTEQMPNGAIIAITLALARLAKRVENIEQADALIKVLESISRSSDLPSLKQWCQIGIAAAANGYYRTAPEQDKAKALQFIASLIEVNPTNEALAIIAAKIYLEKREKVAVATVMQKAISPQVIGSLQRKAHESEDKQQLLTIARFVTAIGKPEEAEKLWRQTLSGNLINKSSVRQEFSELLCHMAVTAYRAGNSLMAVQKLREAADCLNESKRAQDLRQKASQLELQIAVQRLLMEQFPEMDTSDKTTGRYHSLEKIIKQHSELLKVLLAGQTKEIKLGWGRLKVTHRSDMRLLHTRAIIYRELALAGLKKQEQNEFHWIVSTVLWTLLLCTEQ